MTIDAFALLIPGLSMLPRWPEEPAWSDALEDWYFAALSDLPDDVAPALVKFMAQTCRRRPVPADLIEKATELLAGMKPSAVPALEEAFRFRREKGARCVQDGWLTPMKNGQPVKGHDGKQIFVPNMVERVPTFTDALTYPVIDALGGWTAFCESDAPDGVLRAQFERYYAAVRDQAAPSVLKHLRFEFRAQLDTARTEARKALPPPDDDLRSQDDSGPGRLEAAQMMTRLGGVVKSVGEANRA